MKKQKNEKSKNPKIKKSKIPWSSSVDISHFCCCVRDRYEYIDVKDPSILTGTCGSDGLMPSTAMTSTSSTTSWAAAGASGAPPSAASGSTSASISSTSSLSSVASTDDCVRQIGGGRGSDVSSGHWNTAGTNCVMKTNWNSISRNSIPIISIINSINFKRIGNDSFVVNTNLIQNYLIDLI